MIDYVRLARLPFKKYVITYSGSGDEGYVDDVSGYIDDVEVGVGHDLERELEEVAYDILEKYYAGWEINEGSRGELTIDVAEQKTYLHHGTIVESTEWEDVVIT